MEGEKWEEEDEEDYPTWYLVKIFKDEQGKFRIQKGNIEVFYGSLSETKTYSKLRNRGASKKIIAITKNPDDYLEVKDKLGGTGSRKKTLSERLRKQREKAKEIGEKIKETEKELKEIASRKPGDIIYLQELPQND